ncbi:MAG: hypothetical protein IJ899_12805 [Blautia sp.]|nr:hypothetical protein [Blautia sp.]
MNRAAINEAIRAAAKAHGFTTREGFQGLEEPESEELNFIWKTRTTENTDWVVHRVEQEAELMASVRKMGGHPSPEELLKTADEIRRGAELVMELNRMKLTWTEEF